MENSQLSQARHIQSLAEEYASYATSRGGLGNVLGGLAGIVIYLINGLLGRGGLTTVLTIGLTLVWLVGKEVVRKLLYRSFGEVSEKRSVQQKRGQLMLIWFLVGVALCIWIWFGWAYLGGDFQHPVAFWQVGLGLVFAASMPWIAWRYLYNEDELMVGIFLLLCCAIVSVGGVLGRVGDGWTGWAFAAWVPFYALILLHRGWNEHLKFRWLARQFARQAEVQ